MVYVRVIPNEVSALKWVGAELTHSEASVNHIANMMYLMLSVWSIYITYGD